MFSSDWQTGGIVQCNRIWKKLKSVYRSYKNHIVYVIKKLLWAIIFNRIPNIFNFSLYRPFWLAFLMSAFKHNSRPQTPTLKDGDQYSRVINGLKHIYNAKIKPLETTYNFEGKLVLSCPRRLLRVSTFY